MGEVLKKHNQYKQQSEPVERKKRTPNMCMKSFSIENVSHY